jgi:2-methylisocitrate lyase-like PEP mutase family enzyme
VWRACDCHHERRAGVVVRIADKGHLPPRVLEGAVAAIRRVISVPLTVDSENGYSSDPRQVAETVAAIVQAGAVGINLEDGDESPEIFCAKVEAAKTAAHHAGVDLFVNVRTDVYLRRLVAKERALDETLARGTRYRSAGADGLFVPLLTSNDALRTIAQEIPLPLNAMAMPRLAPVTELQKLGVRRVSAGSAIAGMAYAKAHAAAVQMLGEGRYDRMMEWGDDAPDLNELLAPSDPD